MNYYSGKDLARSFRLVRQNTLQIANEIPEEHYGFRATADTRSVAETLAHIAGSPSWQHKLHGRDRKMSMRGDEFGPYIQEAAAYSATLKTKAEIVKALEADGAQFAAWLESLDDETLGEVVAFPAGATPPGKTRFEMLLSSKEHEMHHRAQLMVLQRMIGIVPHLTRARLQQQQRPAEPAVR
ncbi:MAG: DinB family protein [Acidobacteriota bacterium]